LLAPKLKANQVIGLPLLWRENEGKVGKPHVEQNVKDMPSLYFALLHKAMAAEECNATEVAVAQLMLQKLTFQTTPFMLGGGLHQ
jgi:hypothetical protein